MVVTISPPTAQEIGLLGEGSLLIGFLAPLTSPACTRALADAKATALAMEAIPRISRAQSMDALSSQSNVAGYRAALLGAEQMGRFYPMLMTAAGTIPPAKVLVLGAGVAGLQAIATAKRLGARTTGYDVRPEVAEQVRSLGAQWLDLGLEASGEGGYARELTEEERARQQQALTDAIKGFDVVITTALVPGRPAPKLVTEEAVVGMKPGSVVVDLAGEAGGNCELTEPGQTVVRHDVSILAPLNLPATLPEHASALFARNVLALLELLVGEDGALKLDFEDEIVKGACIVREGEIVHPGAKAAVEAAAGGESRGGEGGTVARARARARSSAGQTTGWRLLAMILASVLTTNLAILVLAGFIGFVVISKVPNTLHTPLMSGTNAIHGIVLLGGLMLLGLPGLDGLSKGLLVIAVAFGTINMVGGFLVTDRMLEMFKSKPKHAGKGRGRAGRREALAAGLVGPAAEVGCGESPAPTERGRLMIHAPLATTFLQSESFIYVLYIVAFALFIQGLRGLSGPTSAVRGNRTAAVGMAIAVIATLLNPGEGNWGLIALGSRSALRWGCRRRAT